MDPRFIRGFEQQIDFMLGSFPFKEIFQIVMNAHANVRPENRVPLRPDALVFLVVNSATMIVIPWSVTVGGESLNAPRLGESFFAQHRAALQMDLNEIVAQASLEAKTQNKDDISANQVLSVTAIRTVGTRTRGLNIWGP
jgi:hypothetical protein